MSAESIVQVVGVKDARDVIACSFKRSAHAVQTDVAPHNHVSCAAGNSVDGHKGPCAPQHFCLGPGRRFSTSQRNFAHSIRNTVAECALQNRDAGLSAGNFGIDGGRIRVFRNLVAAGGVISADRHFRALVGQVGAHLRRNERVALHQLDLGAAAPGSALEMQRVILDPDFGLYQSTSSAQESQVALIPLLDDVVGRTIGIRLRGNAMFGSDRARDVSVAHLFVSLHAARSTQTHQTIFGKGYDFRFLRFLKTCLQAADEAVKHGAGRLLRSD